MDLLGIPVPLEWILRHRQGAKLFFHFCQRECSEESVRFWREVCAFRKLAKAMLRCAQDSAEYKAAHEEVSRHTQTLSKNYLSYNATFEVTVDATLRHKVTQSIAKGDLMSTASLLSEALSAMWREVKEDALPRFRKTPYYKRLVQLTAAQFHSQFSSIPPEPPSATLTPRNDSKSESALVRNASLSRISLVPSDGPPLVSPVGKAQPTCLEVYLNNMLARQVLLDFCRSLKCDKLLRFVEDCESFCSDCVSNDELLREQRRVIELYLKSNADLCILPVVPETEELVASIVDASSTASCDLFEDLKRRVLRHIEEEVFPKFLASSRHQDFVEAAKNAVIRTSAPRRISVDHSSPTDSDRELSLSRLDREATDVMVSLVSPRKLDDNASASASRRNSRSRSRQSGTQTNTQTIALPTNDSDPQEESGFGFGPRFRNRYLPRGACGPSGTSATSATSVASGATLGNQRGSDRSAGGSARHSSPNSDEKSVEFSTSRNQHPSQSSQSQKRPFSQVVNVLADPEFRPLFQKFCAEERSEAVLLFWLEVEQYRTLQPRLRSHAEAVHRRFLDSSSPHALPMASEERCRDLLQEINELEGFDEAPEELFDAVQQSALAVMQTDVLPRFSQTAEYRQLVAKRRAAQAGAVEELPQRHTPNPTCCLIS